MNTLKTIDEAIESYNAAKAVLTWLKETAEDSKDNSRVVGFEDCLNKFNSSITNLKALRDKLGSEELVEDVKSALAQVFVTKTRECLAPFTATEAIVRINEYGLAKAAIKAMGV